jgi:hypothetical protein
MDVSNRGFWLLFAVLAVAVPFTAPPPAAFAQGPRKEPCVEVGRYVLPQSILEKPFTFAHESIPIRRKDVRHRIESQLNFLLLDARGVLTEWLAERTQYSWLFEEMFAKDGVPRDFALLAPVLAGLNIFASVRGSTAGWWALPSLCTNADGVEMSSDSWHDDRLDLELSTRCFASRIKNIRQELGSKGWLMPVAAYLTSVKMIQDLQQHWNTDAFWDLPLPDNVEETVTRWIALSIIEANAGAFDLHVRHAQPLTFDQVSGLVLIKDLPIAEIARMTGAPPREILKLNAKIKASQPVFPAVVQGKQVTHCVAAPKGKGQLLVNLLRKRGFLTDSTRP